MAHSHYVMDLNYREERDPDRFRRDVLRIDAKDDADAEAEGRRIGEWRKPDFFVVRAMQKAAKRSERIIFDSRSEQVADDAPDTASVGDMPVEGEAIALSSIEAVSE